MRLRPGLNSFENIAVTLTEGYFHGYDPFRFPQVFDSITKEDVAAFLRRNLTAERAVLSEIVLGRTESKTEKRGTH